ncbi:MULTISPECIES: sugar phosphate isomerase/epimerase family protein [unclassified Sphingomonas]|uniref:sugar phosphate isomerase/epimerase family protein n=1 Tax=unclassified Sphingomonas TaxID=196159 RepID=UPI0006F7E192|nr:MULTISPECIES: TIM barrel protein [unclassified Sphingomonas]KQX18440.1 xylose isomerase [Sphingomonas sp. Root1294]KQY72235.1 xylose isomerase [Sphingomonas sp. Root50]KRB94494.1 xylose isomerase [Sphingomonas sp. Root720]
MKGPGIDFLTVFALPPVEFVELAADLGAPSVSLILEPLDCNPEAYAPYSLRTDRALRRELIAATRDRGVTLALGEGVVVRPDLDARTAYAGDIAIMAELGVRCINILSFDPSKERTFDQYAVLAEMAGAAGIDCAIEFSRGRVSTPDLPTALAARRHVGRPDCRIVLDTMHLIRSGGTAADVAALEPDTVGYVQLCDVPLAPTNPVYFEEAAYARLPPGDGALPLFEILMALRDDPVISVEVPMRAAAEAGVGPRDRANSALVAARALIERVATARAAA